MNRYLFFQLVLMNTLKHRLRAILTIGGIAISSAVVLVLIGISSGLQNIVQSQASRDLTTDVVTVHERNLQRVQLDQKNVAKLEEISGVRQVERSANSFGNVELGDKRASLAVYGMSEGFFSLRTDKVVAGSTDQLNGNGIITSTRTLELLSVSQQNAVGKTLTLSANITKAQNPILAEDMVMLPTQTFTIRGVVNSDAATVYIPLNYFESHGLTRFSEARFKVAGMSMMATIREAVEQMGFQTVSVEDTLSQINRVFNIIHRAIAVFILIVLFIMAMGSFTVVSLSLIDQTRQIGFLRINGARSVDVGRLFLAQSMMITVLGACSGVILAIVIGWVINVIASSADNVLSEQGNIVNFPVLQCILFVVASAALGLFISIVPSHRAISRSPLSEVRA